ncbi:hypothetical protein COV06_00595 [Candidatus Uhrbacteria bacterium CG10_big_fil_rev_8_21_14_0_10_50_16]|uniref:DUF2914 domain-containing protein n=1 Tax=Candidatus Uhrbacteria bacterium CG10_big_fil_rev_8_21_14_0_10_50_16 TaxID=1975039 RepID=A0A2H0RQ55_9BACT|nr:MAG: hypothetical protein COV06_00595 [Candidatus Uhrbacteria bacterium CG10_big_fil_rev_8_21_14_0_10_50_16]
MKEHIKRLTRYYQLRSFYEKYERWLLPAALLVGVAVDFVTFRTIQIGTAFLLLGLHAILAGASIAYVNVYGVGKVPKNRFTRYLRLLAPLGMQFSLGALLSASFIFYWFSGSLSASWPLMILVVFLMISNETLRDYYREPVVQVGVYYFVVLSYCILVLPFWLNSISVWVFVFSGCVSLIAMAFYLHSMNRHLKRFRVRKKKMRTTILIIFACMNGFYFLNIIPPIPLSLTEAGVYHYIESQTDGYLMQEEATSWVDRFVPGQVIHIRQGDQVFVYSSIFAPGKINTRIVHNWQRYNEESGKWESRDKLSFGIAGGRQNGYRGFSHKARMDAGKWRVDVQTTRGQTLGRITFMVEWVEDLPPLQTVIK